MGDWITPQHDWLGTERKPSVKPEVKPREYGVIYHPVRCPKCNSKDTVVTRAMVPIRYHKCRSCKYTFKSTEAE